MENGKIETTLQDHENRIRDLENDRAETRVYTKIIMDDIKDINTKLDNFSKMEGKPESKAWSPIVIELIKLVTTCVLILGGIAGVAKLLGK